MTRSQDTDLIHLLELCRDDVMMGHARADAQGCPHRGADTLRLMLREYGFDASSFSDADLLESSGIAEPHDESSTLVT
jgi:hypothetical protein